MHLNVRIYVNLKRISRNFAEIISIVPTFTALLVHRINTFPQFNEIFESLTLPQKIRHFADLFNLHIKH